MDHEGNGKSCTLGFTWCNPNEPHYIKDPMVHEMALVDTPSEGKGRFHRENQSNLLLNLFHLLVVFFYLI